MSRWVVKMTLLLLLTPSSWIFYATFFHVSLFLFIQTPTYPFFFLFFNFFTNQIFYFPKSKSYYMLKNHGSLHVSCCYRFFSLKSDQPNPCRLHTYVETFVYISSYSRMSQAPLWLWDIKFMHFLFLLLLKKNSHPWVKVRKKWFKLQQWPLCLTQSRKINGWSWRLKLMMMMITSTTHLHHLIIQLLLMDQLLHQIWSMMHLHQPLS